MKRSEAIKKIKESENAFEVERVKKLRELQVQMDLENQTSNVNRARSVTVGTAFGGTTEIMMRGDGGRHLWCLMQPVEVVELIHQLAANIGCHLAIKPRNDFSSWRDWKVSEEQKIHYNGHVPFVNDMAPFNQIGANIEKYEQDMKELEELRQFKLAQGNANVIFDKDRNILNKVVHNGKHVLGGAGGNSLEKLETLDKQVDLNEQIMAVSKPKNGRKVKRSTTAS